MGLVNIGSAMIQGLNTTTGTVFGPTSASYSLQSRKMDKKADMFEGTDSTGNVVAVAAYNQKNILTFDYLFLTGMPTIGNILDRITITDSTLPFLTGSASSTGTNYFITDIGINNTNRDALMGHVELTQWVNIA